MIVTILVVLVVLLLLALTALGSSVRMLREYERGVVFRLGRLLDQPAPGSCTDPDDRPDGARQPAHDHARDPAAGGDHPRQRAGARHRRHLLPRRRSHARSSRSRTSRAALQIAQTTLRSVLGKAELDTLLAERERLNEELQNIIDDQTEPWGIKVTAVEIKDVEIPSGCSTRSPAKPRPSASAGRRSSTPRASSRPPRSSRRRPT